MWCAWVIIFHLLLNEKGEEEKQNKDRINFRLTKRIVEAKRLEEEEKTKRIVEAKRLEVEEETKQFAMLSENDRLKVYLAKTGQGTWNHAQLIFYYTMICKII